MAILKHLSSKNSNYGKALEYLVYQHNEFTQKPILDEKGNMQLRDEYYLDGLNCQPLTFAKECEILNAQYHKNQNANEIKSHHYIISFDPRDRASGLTGEKAQALGLEFSKKYFAGHQALVCTHMDGHNESGNIHVHIVINSLRKYDVELQDFIERDYDRKAGYKHHQTRRYLTAMQEGLMSICEREHLHQVDLLSPAADNVTDREYRLNQWEHYKLIHHREHQTGREKQASNSSTAETTSRAPESQKPFQTQKQFLRNAIREVSSYAKSQEEFGTDLMEYYGIKFKISRGRFSYLHPDRQKYMTGRTLGNDYTEGYLLPLFSGNMKAGRTREQALKEKFEAAHDLNANAQNNPVDYDERPRYDPSYDYSSDPVAALHFHTKLRLVVDLQTCAKAQASRAYARKVKMTNLQQMAQTICYVQEHGIETQTELNNLYLAQQKQLLNSDKNASSHQKLKQSVRDLQVVCANVKLMLQAEPQREHKRNKNKAQGLS